MIESKKGKASKRTVQLYDGYLKLFLKGIFSEKVKQNKKIIAGGKPKFGQRKIISTQDFDKFLIQLANDGNFIMHTFLYILRLTGCRNKALRELTFDRI